MFKNILSCVGRYKRPTILAPVMIIFEVAMEVAIPWVMAQIIDNGITNRDTGYILKMGLLMVLMAMFSLLCGSLSARFASVASTGVAKNLREKLFFKVQDFSFANVDKFSTASLVTRMTTDVTNIQNTFMMMIRMAVRAPIMLLCALCMAIVINRQLAVVFLVIIPLLALALGLIISKAFPLFQKMLKKYDRLNALVQEDLVGIRVVKAFVREDYENNKFQKAADSLRKAQVRAERIIVCNMPIMQIAMYACMLAVSWFGGNLIINGDMLTGELMSFLSYITQILMSLMMLSMIFVMLVMSKASLNRVNEVLDEEIDLQDKEDGAAAVENGSIAFEDVCFHYGERGGQVLDHISLEIASGQTVGIIGGTGSAKTTLVQLIPRLYDVTQGCVRIGGRDVREYQLDALRGAVTMVLQKNVLFSGTIRENLLWGNEKASDEEIQEACKAACAHEFIMSFPQGYETELGQGGVNVSGGQKQRLCIARALLRRPKIMILDDSTSAVDTATDSKIRGALREKLSDTTTIIIAQRVTSVMDADQIIVMDEGRINAVGDHETLLRTNEIYREVYQSQQKGADENAGAE